MSEENKNVADALNEIFDDDPAKKARDKEIVKYLSSNLLEPNIAQNILTEIDKSILSLDEMLYKFVGFQVT